MYDLAPPSAEKTNCRNEIASPVVLIPGSVDPGSPVWH